MIEGTFAQAVRQEQIDLVQASLLFAREIAYPGLEVAAYTAQVEQLAQEADRALKEATTVPERAQTLAHFLFEEQGFRGNVVNYEDPRNSFLNEVLERHLGIPISLSVVYLAVAQRVGLPAHGVGLPGHFVVGVPYGVRTLFFDPFHGGEELTMADCKRLVQETAGYEGPLDPRWLLPTPTEAVLARMLNNLRMIYLQRQAWTETLDVLERLQQVQPEAPQHERDLGLIHYQLGNLYVAAHYLEAYLEKAPDTPEATAIRQNLSADFARWARLN